MLRSAARLFHLEGINAKRWRDADTALSYPPRPGRPPRIPMHGSVGAIVEALGAFQEIGVDHVVFETSTQSHHGALATMEAFMQKVQPQLA